MIIGHIGAREGSRGVVGKNMLPICGRPLIDWSLDLLFDSSLVDVVVVSTDSEAIYSHSVARGALEIGLRPAELASDTAGKWQVWQHSLQAVEQQRGPADVFIDLDCTSPLRLSEDIDDAVALYKAEQPDMVMSCCEARKNPYFNLVEPDESGALQVSKPLPGSVVARQQAPVVYEHAASTYVLNPQYLKNSNALYEGRVIPYLMPVERCMDIDSNLDFRIVEFLLQERLENQNG